MCRDADAIRALFQSDYEQKIKLYEEALTIDPNYVDAIRGLRECFKSQSELFAELHDRLDRAIEYTKRLIDLTPEDESEWFKLYRMYQKKGMDDKARAAWNEWNRLLTREVLARPGLKIHFSEAVWGGFLFMVALFVLLGVAGLLWFGIRQIVP
jgi:DNA-binding SARP family transcriptional activator